MFQNNRDKIQELQTEVLQDFFEIQMTRKYNNTWQCLQSKKDSRRSAVFLGEGIFTMGLVKTIYNVLGGFYN